MKDKHIYIYMYGMCSSKVSLHFIMRHNTSSQRVLKIYVYIYRTTVKRVNNHPIHCAFTNLCVRIVVRLSNTTSYKSYNV